MKLKVFLSISLGFFTQKIGDKCVENIPPETKGFRRAPYFGTWHGLVVFWIFIQFQFRQSNHVQYRNLQVTNPVNLSASA